jgi:TPR repeat protein
MRSFTFSLLTFLLTTTAFAQNEISDPGAKQICASVKDVELPAADRPTAAEEKSLANCSSVDAYFGLGQPADPVKARNCAYAEMDRGEKSLIRGKGILTMVYANGKGVPRNFDVALKLACTIGDAPGDAAGRVHELDRIRKSNLAAASFSICDHSSGRTLYEECAILSDRFDRIERDQKLAQLSAKWKSNEQKAFHTFLQEAEKFYEVQAMNGVNLEGTFEVQEEAFLWNNFLTDLQKFESGDLPKFSAEEVQKARADESAAYQRTQTSEVSHWGTVTREGLRKSEEEWQRYGEAWIAFARQKYPDVSKQSWNAWLDEDRLVALQRFLH